MADRPVKEAAGRWQMDGVKWMFDGSPDIDADTKVMLELRTELSETVKHAEKIVSFDRASGPFTAQCDKVRDWCAEVKDRMTGVVVLSGLGRFGNVRSQVMRTVMWFCFCCVLSYSYSHSHS